ncbi:MAG: PKD domain-containing protein [Bacteroidetes bacterium]|nr:PKD domain-containing protein [Bacteroidota bacterium]
MNEGADINLVKLKYEGAKNLHLVENNRLSITTTVNKFEEYLPLAYIFNKGKVEPVNCIYQLRDNILSFKTSKDYSTFQLVLDPILVFSTYSGSTVDNFGFTATYDSRGCLYAGGIASRPTNFPNGRYPTTAGVFQYTYGGGNSAGWEGFPCDISISKYTPSGDSLIWATYLGGSRNEYPHSIVVDPNDQLIVFGTTTSSNFPVVNSSFDNTYNGAFDMVVTKFNHDATNLIGSTFLGGSNDDGFNIDGPLKYNYADEFRGEVDVDDNGNIYIASCSRSDDFPVSSFAPQSKFNDSLDAVMVKFDSLLSQVYWSSYWGKVGHDAFYSVEVVNDSLVYFGGSTTSRLMRTDSSAIDTAYKGGRADGYIACFTNDSLQYKKATYIGTADYNQVYFIEQDIKGKIYATGQTEGVFPVVGSVYSQPKSGQFIIKLSPDLDEVLLSTTFGNGSEQPDLKPSAFMVDYCENVYFSGWGSDVANPEDQVGTTNGLYVSNNAVQKTTDGNDFYLIVFSKNLQNIAYATYFGSPGQSGEFNDHVDGGTSRFDPRGVVYQSVCSSCPAGNLTKISNFPTTANAYSKTNPSPRCSNASFKIDFQITNAVIANFTAQPAIQCFPGNINIMNKSVGGKRFFWDFGDGIQDTAKHPTHTYTAPGEYKIRLIVFDSNSCNVADTTSRSITLLQKASAKFDVVRDSCTYKVIALNKSNFAIKNEWHWGDGTTDSVSSPQHIYLSKGTYTIKLVINKGMPCSDSIEQNVTIDVDSSINADFIKSPSSGCSPLTVIFNNKSSVKGGYRWSFGDGKTDTVENPIHTYRDSGIFVVKLNLTDIYGCGLKDSMIDLTK